MNKKKQQIQVNGREESSKPTTLEAIFGGFNELARYGTLEESEYLKYINDLNRTDLYEHARKIGLGPVETVARLKDNLIREFRSYVTYLNKPTDSKSSNSKISSKVEKILAEGR
jgi:hypothetical protein